MRSIFACYGVVNICGTRTNIDTPQHSTSDMSPTPKPVARATHLQLTVHMFFSM